LDEMAACEKQGVPPIGVGSDSIIEDAIVDKNARIGRGVRIINQAKIKEKDGDGYFIRDGIVIVLKEAVIANGTVI
jgi:glucose-1-phosphate adenylyltransferase